MEKYKSKLDLYDTQIAIKKIKDYFETELSKKLHLMRVSAPLFATSSSGLNDDLSGVERPVSFDTKEGLSLEIVQSLAKWKRYALYKYNLKENEGIYTDMNAIRRDEIVDFKHSYYVDQWDWEKNIKKEERSLDKLKEVVDSIYKVLKDTDNYIAIEYPVLSKKLPDEIFYISSQELEDMYPSLSPSKREYEISKKHTAVCITGIGKTLKSGEVHDKRSPDYDDWELNCDIVLYNKVLDDAFEISSMGIRVDKEALIKQLKATNKEERLNLEYHQSIINEIFPLTIGGGIGQSRLCMFFLEKIHIGEVQASSWPLKTIEECEEKGIILL